MSSESRVKVVLASGNRGKLAELQRLLAPLGIDLVSQHELGIESVEETGLTFVENALAKARHASSHCGLPAIADDSGLVVDALGGAPGIHSARYAGAHAHDRANNDKLVQALAGLQPTARTAKFHCTLVYLRDGTDPTPVIAEGEWHGVILNEPRGTAGFGYDPLFYVEGLQATVAELEADVKNSQSHRGLAAERLIARLREARETSA